MRQRLFLGLVAVLPLHTVYLSAWISWKPFLVLLAVLAVWDLVEGIRERAWPWHSRVSLAFGVFMATVAIGFPEPEFRTRFIRLTLALLVGFLVTVVTERALRVPGMLDRTLRVIFWTAAAMAVSGVVFSVLLLGAGGNEVIDYLTGSRGYDLPLFDKIGKPAYLLSGFLALSNWHPDPGYGAAWMVLWSTLALIASQRGLGTRRPWLDGAIIGALWVGVVMAFSRTGWVALLVSVGIVAFSRIKRRLGAAFDAQKPGRLGRTLVAAVLSAVLILTGLFAVDVKGVGGELPLQFAFRLRQGWDFLADLTGLFQTSAAFEDQFSQTEQRADVWPEYWRLFLDHPATGAGLGVGWETNSVGQEPHNLFLELGAETGLVGLAAFVLLVATIIGAGAGLVGGVALTTSFLPAMTQTVLFEPSWWFAAGLFLAGGFRAAGDRPRSKREKLKSPQESGVITPTIAGD
jgi:O-antigen ligase